MLIILFAVFTITLIKKSDRWQTRYLVSYDTLHENTTGSVSQAHSGIAKKKLSV